MKIECDYLVLGSGVAGLTLALEAASHGRVAVITKRQLSDSNTAWAQGGIAAVIDPKDSFAAHTTDTLNAGYGLNKRKAVEMVVEGAPPASAASSSSAPASTHAAKKSPASSSTAARSIRRSI